MSQVAYDAPLYPAAMGVAAVPGPAYPAAMDVAAVPGPAYPAAMDVAAVPGPARPAAMDVAAVPGPATEWTDEQLVQACLDGHQRAWELLIAKYKALICSFPRKYGARAEDAADVFQLVCADLFVALPRLRNHDSVRSWICTVATHRAYHWKRRHVIHARRQTALEAEPNLVAPPSGQLLQAEREHRVRDAVARLPQRHRAVIELLFFQEPPLPYLVVAERLGIAPGSVSFLRARSLRELERLLDGLSLRAAPSGLGEVEAGAANST